MVHKWPLQLWATTWERPSNQLGNGNVQLQPCHGQGKPSSMLLNKVKNLDYILPQRSEQIAYVLPIGKNICFYHIFLLSRSKFYFLMLQPMSSKGRTCHAPNP